MTCSSTAKRVIAALLLALAAAQPLSARADGNAGARLDIVDLHQSDQALAVTYAKGKRMMLPRLILLDAQGRALLVEIGSRGGVGGRLEAALAKDKPLDTVVSLDMVLAETVNANGSPVVAADLPRADGYVVDYWAEWCGPCRLLSRDIGRQLKRWDGKHVVWLKIESDPEKQQKKKSS